MNINNLENGHYIKARICGVNEREVMSKTSGELFVFYSLVIETSDTAQKEYINFGKKQQEKGLVNALRNPKYKGAIALIPVYMMTKDGYTSTNYSGDHLPLFLADDVPPKTAAQPAASTARQ